MSSVETTKTLVVGINAEGKSLETITKPLTSTAEEQPLDASPALAP